MQTPLISPMMFVIIQFVACVVLCCLCTPYTLYTVRAKASNKGGNFAEHLLGYFKHH